MACVLCGTVHGNEVRPREQIETFVLQRYCEGPFAWPALRSSSGENILCCVHCLNHIRKRKAFRRKHMLPMDQYLLGLLSPGLMSRVDMRSRKRLRRVLAQRSNPYATSIGCAPLQAIMCAPDPVACWWDLNLRTKYFADSNTARIVRQAVCKP
jgi:hypothetical protein